MLIEIQKNTSIGHVLVELREEGENYSIFNNIHRKKNENELRRRENENTNDHHNKSMHI